MDEREETEMDIWEVEDGTYYYSRLLYVVHINPASPINEIIRPVDRTQDRLF